MCNHLCPAQSSSTPSSSTSDPHESSVVPPTDEPLDQNRAIPTKNAHNMRRARKTCVRVQSGTPELMEGRFVSSYAASSSDLKSAYLDAIDTVNTESVEGVLAYVQATH
ncbi:unnamed protein product [Albugo candida]|uniref:Uncharacterized protein n=1 Tax=Albugo candida TaxID=65357 RepID=A0A024GS14_9STRA|nr:unnamed protein product [Albugo candida]|eukprot:CCI49712.1 unnamed protein product [Albugo candida]